jgi:hypothetical protein
MKAIQVLLRKIITLESTPYSKQPAAYGSALVTSNHCSAEHPSGLMYSVPRFHPEILLSHHHPLV